MKKKKVNLSIDVGNGYTKASINDVTVKFPSIVAVNFGRTTIPLKAEEAEEFFKENIYNQLDASFDSVLVENKNRRLFGERAIQSGFSTEEFDVSSTVSKSEVDLSGVLVLGAIAGRVLVDYWNENHKLPEEIVPVECNMVTSLPISEYRHYRDVYAQKYMNGEHLVTIYNFETPIRVSIKFTMAKVVAESESGGYCLSFGSDNIIQTFLDQARADGQELEGITIADLKAVKSSMSVDIGEGTMNIAVFTNSRFNFDASNTYPKGYGTVLNATIDRLRDMGYHFKDRKEISEFMSSEPSALARARYNKVLQVVNEEIELFSNEIAMQVSRAISKSGGFVECIFVSGGGAVPMKPALYPKLLKLTKILFVVIILNIFLKEKCLLILNARTFI